LLIGRRHRAVDIDREQHGIAVVDQRRDVDMDPAAVQWRFADNVADRVLYRRGRGPRRLDPDGRNDACAGDGAEDFAPGLLPPVIFSLFESAMRVLRGGWRAAGGGRRLTPPPPIFYANVRP
jgi:hypothetical protein